MIYVIYHKNCFDGFCAAWVADSALKARSLSEGTSLEVGFIPASYGDEAPQINIRDEVYILDFSYPRDILRGMNFLAQKVVVLDHHKTAQENLEGLDFCIFDMNRSGAGLTWDYFNEGKPRPPLVNYMEDRDLWRFKLDNSREVFAYVSSFPMDFDTWDNMNDNFQDDPSDFGGAVVEGAAILRAQDQKIETASREAFMVELKGHEVPVVNVPYYMASDTGHLLLEQYPGAPFAATYFINAQQEQQWSLRGRDTDGFDVSAIAKQFGGGGHAKAAGFIMGRDTRG